MIRTLGRSIAALCLGVAVSASLLLTAVLVIFVAVPSVALTSLYLVAFPPRRSTILGKLAGRITKPS